MTETSTVGAVDVISDGDAAAAPDNPNITCSRCGTLTTWNPYCPSCGAYLEFSGSPAWHPDEQLSTLPPVAPTVVPALVASDPTTPGAEIDASADKAASAETDAAASSDDNDHEPQAADSETQRVIASLFDHVDGDIGAAEEDLTHAITESRTDLEGDLHPTEHGVKPWWASWGDAPAIPLDESDIPAMTISASSGILPAPDDQNPVVFTSRRIVPAPEIVEPGAELPGLPMDETQKTRAMGNEEFAADGETCTRCALTNPAGRQYCDWCGTPLPEVMLGPESDAYNPYGLKSSGVVEVSTAPRRSYAVKLIVLIIVLVTLIWAVWYFFFGPRAEETRTGIKIVAQEFTEWLAPSIGASTTITNVTASSSLTGTSPLALKTLSSRDFWASAPMTLYGAGSKVTFTFDKKYEIDRIAIYPGIQNQTFDVNALGTPKTLTIDVGDGKKTEAHVSYVQSNNDYEQIIAIPTVLTDKVTITFDEVYPPRYPDPNGDSIGEVSVSSFAFLQVPSATTVNPLAASSPSPSPSASGSASASPSSSASASGSASASPSSTAKKKKKSASASPTPSVSASPKPSASASPKPSASGSAAPSPSPSTTS